MRKLSTGDDSTLGNWRKLSAAFFGKNSKPVKFLDQKIKKSPNGKNEEVVVDEAQFLHALGQMMFGGLEGVLFEAMEDDN